MQQIWWLRVCMTAIQVNAKFNFNAYQYTLVVDLICRAMHAMRLTLVLEGIVFASFTAQSQHSNADIRKAVSSP